MLFRYRHVQGGKQRGFLASDGEVTETHLFLEGTPLALSDLVAVQVREKQIAFVLDPAADLPEGLEERLEEGGILCLQVSRGDPREIERRVDRVVSAAWAEKKRAELESLGRGASFRAMICPECQATVEFSNVPETPLVCCNYCGSILDREGERSRTSRGTHRLCEDCGLYDRVHEYTEFYFYFLVVFYGWSSRTRSLCPNCAGRLFWKVLAWNFFFLIGIPPALSIQFKRWTLPEEEYPGLTEANARALRGELERAAELYKSADLFLYQDPGLTYNLGRCRFQHGDVEGAFEAFQRSLESCSNYVPTLGILSEIQEVVGELED